MATLVGGQRWQGESSDSRDFIDNAVRATTGRGGGGGGLLLETRDCELAKKVKRKKLNESEEEEAERK